MVNLIDGPLKDQLEETIKAYDKLPEWIKNEDE